VLHNEPKASTTHYGKDPAMPKRHAAAMMSTTSRGSLSLDRAASRLISDLDQGIENMAQVGDDCETLLADLERAQ